MKEPQTEADASAPPATTGAEADAATAQADADAAALADAHDAPFSSGPLAPPELPSGLPA